MRFLHTNTTTTCEVRVGHSKIYVSVCIDLAMLLCFRCHCHCISFHLGESSSVALLGFPAADIKFPLWYVFFPMTFCGDVWCLVHIWAHVEDRSVAEFGWMHSGCMCLEDGGRGGERERTHACL